MFSAVVDEMLVIEAFLICMKCYNQFYLHNGFITRCANAETLSSCLINREGRSLSGQWLIQLKAWAMPSWKLCKAAPLETHDSTVLCGRGFCLALDPLCWIHSRSHALAEFIWPLTRCSQGRVLNAVHYQQFLCCKGQISCLNALLHGFRDKCQSGNTFCLCHEL